jgi:hypothetical protein
LSPRSEHCHLGVNFVTRLGECTPLRSPPGGEHSLKIKIMNRRTEDLDPPLGHNFAHRGQSSPLGAAFKTGLGEFFITDSSVEAFSDAKIGRF